MTSYLIILNYDLICDKTGFAKIPDSAISIWTQICLVILQGNIIILCFSSLNVSHWGFQTKFQQYLKLCSACQDEKADISNYSKNKSKLCYSQQWTHICLFKFLRKSSKERKWAKQILKRKQSKSPELWKSISAFPCGYRAVTAHFIHTHFHTGIRWKTSSMLHLILSHTPFLLSQNHLSMYGHKRNVLKQNRCDVTSALTVKHGVCQKYFSQSNTWSMYCSFDSSHSFFMNMYLNSWVI